MDDINSLTQRYGIPNMNLPAGDIYNLYSQYRSPYEDQISQAQKRAEDEQKALQEMLKNAAPQQQGPSQAELLLKLGNAFLSPGKTGNFMEGVGRASEVGADYLAQRRDAQAAQTKEQLGYQIQAQQMRAQQAAQEMQALRALAVEDKKSAAEIFKKMIEEDIRSGRPQSEAGKMAVDAGLTPGSKPYADFVNHYVNQKLDGMQRYGGLQAAIDENGNPVFIQANNSGGAQAIPGYRPFSADPTAQGNVSKAKAEAAAEGKTSGEYRGQQGVASERAPRTIETLGKIEEMLPKATGSGLGRARDAAAAVFGKSTEGAQYSAAIKPYAASLVMQVPRMEGPQSDKDTQLYKEAAGNLADDSLPHQTRMAALKILKDIAKRQAAYGNESFATSESGMQSPSVILYDAQGRRVK